MKHHQYSSKGSIDHGGLSDIVTTAKQALGEWGETQVSKKCSCPKCKNSKTLKKLPQNFKCVDVICDFCGFLGQVKTKNVKDIDKIPKTILGAAWGPQKERMDAGIFFPLFIVLKDGRRSSIFYLPVDYQDREIFVERKPLSSTAKRAGWQGYYFDLTNLIEEGMIRRLI